MDQSSANPLHTISLTAPDGVTTISLPIQIIDSFNDETASICINYGSQIGACITMLAAVLIMTPTPKLSRPSNVLHILGLLVCLIRMVLLSVYFISPFNHFYQVWAADYSSILPHDFHVSVTGNVFSLFLIVVIEAALMNQAWTMVALWPSTIKYIISMMSVLVTLMTVSWRLASTVIQSQAVLNLESARPYAWVFHAQIITNAISIFWFCALFNVKLVLHLVSNRGILPSRSSLNPMEILVMTNGILMIVPVIFAGLEWGTFTNFEAASLTPTSVAIILPLGTLAAQRMANKNSMAYLSDDSNRRRTGSGCSAPLKGGFGSFSASSGTATAVTPQTSVLSRCEQSAAPTCEILDPIDLELRQIDEFGGSPPKRHGTAPRALGLQLNKEL